MFGEHIMFWYGSRRKTEASGMLSDFVQKTNLIINETLFAEYRRQISKILDSSEIPIFTYSVSLVVIKDNLLLMFCKESEQLFFGIHDITES
jgi:hypothetical protein